jgi:hypothetical protein
MSDKREAGSAILFKNQNGFGKYLMCLLSTAVIYGALLMIFHLL